MTRTLVFVFRRGRRVPVVVVALPTALPAVCLARATLLPPLRCFDIW